MVIPSLYFTYHFCLSKKLHIFHCFSVLTSSLYIINKAFCFLSDLRIRKTQYLSFKMALTLYFSKNPLPWIVVLVLLFIFSGFLGFGFSSIFLTSLVLILSTAIFKFSKQKPVLVDKPVKDHEANVQNKEGDQEDEVGEIEGNLVISTSIFQLSKQKPLLVDNPVKDHEANVQNKEGDEEDEVVEIEGNLVISTSIFQLSQQKPVLVDNPVKNHEANVQNKEGDQEDEVGEIEGNLVISTSIFQLSQQKPLLVDKPVKDHEANVQNKEADQEDEVGEIEGNLVISPDSECESFDHSYTSEDSDCSDDSISDEESLIEITLPSGHHVDPEEEEEEEEEEGYKCNLQQEIQGFSPELICRQPNEVNEEDNLIEIDISMGSIKCSRFEIEA